MCYSSIMYRTRRKGSQRFCDAMRRGREEALLCKMQEPAPNYPYEPPELRRILIIEDYDHGRVVRHEFKLHRSDRIDCYRLEIDGKELPDRIGWAKVIELARKAFIRVSNRW